VPIEEPSWWYAEGEPPLAARMLAPAAAVYGSLSSRRMLSPPAFRSRLPVVCVGNFTSGGTGKTPLAIRIAAEVRKLGARPGFLSRGHGGRIKGPHRVTPADTAADVGDEPLLLARHAPVVISADRPAGARAIEAATGDAAADVIIMDDGLQNPYLAKSLVIALVDGRRGFGNGRVIPAGPLRAPLMLQLGLADAIVVTAPLGTFDDKSAVADHLRRDFKGPVLTAETRPAGAHDWLSERPLVAYCGIGAPDRFFTLLEALGARLAGRQTFADHHAYTATEAQRLLDLSSARDAGLVTTEKDLARLTGLGGNQAALAAASRALAIETAFGPRDEERLIGLLRGALMSKADQPGRLS